jgi:ATP-dependent protease ClpP protease subunit
VETIYIVGEIDEAAFKRFDMKLTRLEQESDSISVRIVLSSGGGSAYDALSFYGRIRQSALHTEIECFGTAFSAALLILAAGDERRMDENAWAMAHEDTTDVAEYHKVAEAEKAIAHGRRLETQWYALLAERTSTNAAVWEHLHREETYLTPARCLELGLIDEIVGPRVK